MEGSLTDVPTWISLMTTYLGVPIGVAVILIIAAAAIRLAWNLYKVHDARSDGSLTSFDQLTRILENRDKEITRMTQLAEDASARASEAYKERNDAVANAKAQEVRIEILTEQVKIQSERIRELETQVNDLTHKISELLGVLNDKLG